MIVILMVPVSVFAAVVAMAVPERLSAESALEDAASDLAALAAAWRDAQGREYGRLDAYFPACDSADEPDVGDSPGLAVELERVCRAVTDAVLSDLEDHGFDLATMRGYYSAALSTTAAAAGELSWPCAAGGGTVIADASHVGFVARWTGRSWAAQQAMPEGAPMGSQAIGRIAYGGGSTDIRLPYPSCGQWLDLVPSRLAPAAGDDPSVGRDLSEDVPLRTAFSR
ncbi:hypothetical protein [Candidatus Poriferisodalis sp.]|uniref:hypothetical protein n=1 Tax=Candidatus Poriferisodalis sp. TaxID=3101277 RepID=UPI003B02A824